MCVVTENLIEEIWQKATPVEGYDNSKFRKDASGAWIKRDKYNNKESIFGWEIDHIYPKSKLRELKVPNKLIDDPINLRPFNWLNNESKGQDYPGYTSTITSVNNRNKREMNFFEIDENTQAELRKLYSEYL